MKRFIVCFVALILGMVGGFGVITYINLPLTEELAVSEEVFYSKTSPINANNSADISLTDADVSVHFLELGNKYTGDCTYIKATGKDENGVAYETDILIDCGSKSNSVATVSEYLNKYVTDGKLEYVIVTHAHQDHYAGFATPSNVNSIFDLYEIGTIIYFAQTNQKETSSLYKNFKRELSEAEERGAKTYKASECVENSNGAKSEYVIGNTESGNITLNILESMYYTTKATTENDYSVCTLVKTPEQKFLFTGDLEEKGEKWLAERYDEGELNIVDCDLYKAGHHGSKTSSTDNLMSVVKPKVVCVCCCAGSPEYTKNVLNQFPTQKFIDVISKYTECVYVTTLCVNYSEDEFESFNGNIVYIAKKSEHNVQCSNNNIVLKNSGWLEKNERTWTNESLVKAPAVA